MSKIFISLLISLFLISCATRKVSPSCENPVVDSKITGAGTVKSIDKKFMEKPVVFAVNRAAPPSAGNSKQWLLSLALPLPSLPVRPFRSLISAKAPLPPGGLPDNQARTLSDKQLERQLRVPDKPPEQKTQGIVTGKNERPQEELSQEKLPVKEPEKSNPENVESGEPAAAQTVKRGRTAGKQPMDQKAVGVPLEKHMELVVQGKDNVVISLQGKGWIFFGASYKDKNNKELPPVITFVDKKTRKNSTDYFFKADSVGNYVLNFQQQGASRAVSMVVSLKVEKKPNVPAVQQKKNPEGDNSVQKKTVEELLDNGEYSQIIENIGRDEGLVVILAYGVRHKKVPALAFFADEMTMSGAFSSSADSGLKGLKGDPFTLLSKGGKILISGGALKQGVELLKASLFLGKWEQGGDAVLYLLGYAYQNESSIRDERKAAFYYKRLLDEYPESLYWDEAKGAYVFLKRRYIDVR